MLLKSLISMNSLSTHIHGSFPVKLEIKISNVRFRQEKDLVLFNNRGLIHTVVGVFKDDQIRLFHQCNLAGTDEPLGPNDADIQQWA